MRKLDTILQGMDKALFSDMCYFDLRMWSERVFGYTPKDFHLEWMSLTHQNRHVMLEAFRGSGKTLFLGIIYPTWLAYYHPGYEILFSASELGQATKILDELKETVENNEFLKDLMPPNPSTWKKTQLRMTNSSMMWCRAFTKSIKGVHVNYAFVDEIQDIKDREVFWKGVMPTIENKNGHILCAGVPDNPGDMIDELAHNPKFIHRQYPVIIKPGVARWPERFPLDKIQEIRQKSEAMFQTQYMLNPRAEGDNDVFPFRWIENCFDTQETFGDLKFEQAGSLCFLGADFAISQGKRADFDCYVIVEKISGKTIIRHAERHKGLSTDAKKERLRQLHRRFKPLRMVLDPSNVGGAILQDLRNEGYPVQEGEFHARARHQMLVNLQMMMQPDKNGKSQLVIPRNSGDENAMHFSNILVNELLGFKEEKSDATGISTYMSKAPHDDTVASLALACKASNEQREFLDIVAI